MIWNATIAKKLAIYQEIALKMEELRVITAAQMDTYQEIVQKGKRKRSGYWQIHLYKIPVIIAYIVHKFEDCKMMFFM